MKHFAGAFLMAIVTLMVLVGCMVAPPVSGPANPYYRRAEAEAEIMDTEQARDQQREQATIQSSMLRDRMTATAEVYAWELTATAAPRDATQTQQARQTGTAVVEQQVATGTAVAEQMATKTAQLFVVQTQTAWPGQATEQARADIKWQRDEQSRQISHFAGIATRIILPGGLLALFVLVVSVAWKNRDYVRRLLEAWELRARVIERGENKDPLIILRLQDGRPVVYDSARLPGAAGVLGKNGIEVSGLGDLAALAIATIARAQAADMLRAMPAGSGSAGGQRGKGAGEMLIEGMQAAEAAAVGQPPAIAVPTVAPWDLFSQYTNGPIPMGLDEQGKLMAPDLEMYAHRLFAGKTNAGKSRYGIRPFLVGALGRGMAVLMISELPPVDFVAFEGQPRFRAITLDEPAQAINCLEQINREVKRRWEVLYQNGVSTWSRLPNAEPDLMVVFDEFADLVDALESRERTQFFAQAANISRIARKAGIHLLAGVQNPTADNIRPSIRRNMLSMVFHVADAQASRAILEADGAERLQGLQYLARMGDLQRGVAFDPTDQQVSEYLAFNRPQGPHPNLDWVRKEIPAQVVSIPEDSEEQEELKQRVLDLQSQGIPATEIAKTLYGYKGGSGYNHVKDILEQVTGYKVIDPGGNGPVTGAFVTS